MNQSASKHSKGDILIVDDDLSNLRVLTDILRAGGYDVRGARNGRAALEFIENATPDLVLLDVRMPGMDGFQVCGQLKADERHTHLPVIFLSALQDTKSKVRGFEVGGVDFISKPFQVEEVLVRVHTHITLERLQKDLQNEVNKQTAALRKSEALLKEAYDKIKAMNKQLKAEGDFLRHEIKLEHGFEHIIGNSDALKYVLYMVEQVAVTDTTVLILGETGTGKELVARAIHESSDRSKRTVVKVNCAALPSELIESELFGHESGAFTSADKRKLGRFEIANGSTLFLDEIGELPLDLQAKLLRVLEDGQFERLGGTETLTVDVRIIAATNRDLKKEVREGRFREDLWYRLNVYTISVPALRDRVEDINLLVPHFVQLFSKKFGKPIPSVSARALKDLKRHGWPGNIRELKHTIERAMITWQNGSLRFDRSQPLFSPTKSSGKDHESRLKPMVEIERHHILRVLNAVGWKIEGPDGAAETLKLNQSTLRSRMKKLGIHRNTK